MTAVWQSGRPARTAGTRPQDRGSAARLPARRRQLEALEAKGRRDRAAHERPVAEGPRRLPLAGADDDLGPLTGADVVPRTWWRGAGRRSPPPARVAAALQRSGARPRRRRRGARPTARRGAAGSRWRCRRRARRLATPRQVSTNSPPSGCARSPRAATIASTSSMADSLAVSRHAGQDLYRDARMSPEVSP